MDLAKTDYENQNVDIATVLSVQREVLQVAIQIAQVEAELGKALASLERAVGCEVNDRTLERTPAEKGVAAPSPPPAAAASPFRRNRLPAAPGLDRGDTPPKPR